MTPVGLFSFLLWGHMATKTKRIQLRNAKGQFSKPQARVRVWSDGTKLEGAARDSVLKSRKRERRAARRAPVVKPVPEEERSEAQILLDDSWRVLLPSEINPDLKSSFRDFIMPVSRLRSSISRQTFVLVRIDEPTYLEVEGDPNVIIPMRIGNSTRKQLLKMDRKDFEREISFHEKSNKVTEFLGVYVRKQRKGK